MAQLSFWHVAVGNLHQIVPSPWSQAICILIAFLCGAIVGFERERGHKPAGLRTQILICVGSAIFTVISMSAPLGGREPARIAAQIVTGVGFLGAGSIMRDRYQITGLTTAATIWTVSALGIVAGAGYVTPAVALSVAVYLVLASFRHAELLFAGRCSTTKVVVVYRAEKGKTRALIMQALDESHGPLCVTAEAARVDGLSEMSLSYCDRHKDHRAFMATLAGMAAVEALEETAAECKA
jgi:putative Mg2+ transporter-C (MgtC) family protein